MIHTLLSKILLVSKKERKSKAKHLTALSKSAHTNQ